MVLLDLNQDKTLRNSIEVYFINLYLREYHSTLTLKIYDTMNDTASSIEVECEKLGKGITTVYIDYNFKDNSSYEIELEKDSSLIYRGQISTGKDFVTVDASDNRNLLKY